MISQFTKELISSQCFNFIHRKKNILEIQRAVEARTYKHYLLYHIVHQFQIPASSDKSNSLGQGENKLTGPGRSIFPTSGTDYCPLE